MVATLRLVAALVGILAAGLAAAQTDYPQQTIHILVGFTPGVGPDIVSRLLGDKFSAAWGKPVVVENVTGAGGNIACERTARAAPDGYTLVMCGNGTLIFSPSMYDKMNFDPAKDLTPIAQVFVAANVLVVHPDVPVKSISELVALARAEPGKLTFAHAGIGTSQHLAGELFKYITHIDIQPVAYRGTTALLPDLLAGRVTMSFANIVNAVPLAREGKLRAFAVTSLKRSAIAPDLPTMAESGYPGFEAVPWFGLMAPAGTPPGIVAKLHDAAVKVLAEPDVRAKLTELGLDIIGNSPAEFSAAIASETPQWAKVIKAAGIRISE
jgi:tripartite-type tricarboxylate transporter receptor subunit TctC